ncbi:MAG: hypothetical protein EOL97_12860 [Spirochaetia bacterium]|nr:hypothetical protein [Spirochaetia bacterium]
MAYTGKQSFVLVGEETAYNTAVATTKDLGVIASVDASLNNNTITIDSIGCRQAIDLLAGNFDGTLSFSGTLNSGAILEMFFGQSTDDATSTDYRHVFVDKLGTEVTALPVASNTKSYTISTNHDDTTDVVFTYSGCKINSLSMNLEVGGALTFDAEAIIGNVTTSTTVGTKICSTTQPLMFAQGSVSTGTAGSEAVKTPVSNFSITFNNNIDTNDIRGIGSRKPIDLIVKKLELTGDFTAKFGDKTEADRFLGGATVINGTPADTSIIFEVTNGVTVGSGRIGFYVKYSGCQYESLGRNFSQDGMVEESYSFIAQEVSLIYFDDQTSTYF